MTKADRFSVRNDSTVEAPDTASQRAARRGDTSEPMIRSTAIDVAAAGNPA
jgi:hypothetical protein